MGLLMGLGSGLGGWADNIKGVVYVAVSCTCMYLYMTDVKTFLFLALGRSREGYHGLDR